MYVRRQLGHVNPSVEAYWAHGKLLLDLGMSLFNSESNDLFSLDMESFFKALLRVLVILRRALPLSPSCFSPSKLLSANQQIAFESKRENK